MNFPFQKKWEFHPSQGCGIRDNQMFFLMLFDHASLISNGKQRFQVVIHADTNRHHQPKRN